MIKPYTFTADDFAVMVQAGLFHDQRVELLDGVIVDMSPSSPGHEYAVDIVAENLMRVFLDRARVRVQNAVNIELPRMATSSRCRLGQAKRLFRSAADA